MPQTKEEKAKKQAENHRKRMENPEWREKKNKNNKEKIKIKRLDPEVKKKDAEYSKNEYHNNKEFYQEKAKKYKTTENGKKSYRISNWKYAGIKDEDFDSLYDYYLAETNCWICGHDFSKYNKSLDHDHETSEVRYICCNKCNITILNSSIGNKSYLKVIEEY